MADNEEILKYKVDIGDAEAKFQRLMQLAQQISTKRAAGEDTADLEQQLNKELGALGQLSPAMKKHSNIVEELDKNKRDLADVVNLLGGSFGGLLGDVLGTVQAFTMLGRTVGWVAAIMAALSILQNVFSAISGSVKEAEDRLRKLAETLKQLRDERLDLRVQVADELVKAGQSPAQTGQTVQAAEKLINEQGVPKDLALNAAIAKTTGNLPDEQVQQFLGGLVVGGREPVSFPEDQAAREQLIQKVMEAGKTSEAQQVLRDYLKEVGSKSKREGPPPAQKDEARSAAIDTIQERLKKEHPELNEEDRRLVGEILQDRALETPGGEEAFAKKHAGFFERVGMAFGFSDEARRVNRRQVQADDASKNMGELFDLSKQYGADVPSSDSRAGAPGGPTGASNAGSTINIHFHRNTYNGTQLNGTSDQRMESPRGRLGVAQGGSERSVFK